MAYLHSIHHVNRNVEFLQIMHMLLRSLEHSAYTH